MKWDQDHGIHTQIVDGHFVLVNFELDVVLEDREGGENGARCHGRFPSTLSRVK